METTRAKNKQCLTDLQFFYRDQKDPLFRNQKDLGPEQNLQQYFVSALQHEFRHELEVLASTVV